MLFISLTIAALTSIGAARQCTNYTIPLSVSARNAVFNLATPSSPVDVTNFALDLTRQGHNLTNELLTGYNTVSGNYNISATLCNPDSGASSVLQVLTHGIGFDKSYWDFPYANYNYSYVDAALAKGYSTFAFDRLGIGMSSHGEPVNEIQSFLEVAALAELTQGLKAGNLPGVKCGAFKKVINVGHSFGSAQTYALTTMYPNITDGIVLTGFSMNASFVADFVLGSNFIQAKNYQAGYIAPTSAVGVQIDFFSPHQFDPAVLALAFATGQPVTPGELLTLGSLIAVNPFAGPVLVVTGGRDIPYCGGDCLITGNPALASIPTAVSKNFANAKAFNATIIPGAGHGLNLEYSHTYTYSHILAYLAANGLSA